MKKQKRDSFVKINNQEVMAWFGMYPSKKWAVIKKLEAAGFIKVERMGQGKTVRVQIILPTLH